MHGVVVANVSPAQICCAETVSTLKFAARAKHIRCSVVRNEAFSGTVESLMEEVKLLRKELVQLSGRSFERAKGLSLDSSKAVLEEPEAEDREEEAPHLSSQQRVTRLEVLLAAALEREQQAEQKGHRLQRLSGFLEDLDFRKCHGVRKLHKEYWEQLVPQVEASSITDDPEVQELSSKLKSRGPKPESRSHGLGDYEPEAANSTTAAWTKSRVDESFSPGSLPVG
ncbi:unnamed protein product [Effrenium voratum]|nr:unnamed protein product [Effrenium voratum]